MRIINSFDISATKECYKVLSNNDIVLLPTDTVYGLAANAYSNEAIKKIYQVKQRNYSKRLPIFIKSIEVINDHAIINDIASKIIENFMPGAITIVLPIKPTSPLVNNKFLTINNSAAFRIPKNDFCLKLLRYLHYPLACTSANISGHESVSDFNKIDQTIINNLQIGIAEKSHTASQKPSTIVEVNDQECKIIREGSITHQHLKPYLTKKY